MTYSIATFTVEVQFSYSTEEDYCENFTEIMQRIREYASAEVVGEVERKRVGE